MLPEWRRNTLSSTNRELNQLGAWRLIELYHRGELVSMIDEGMAINLDSKGVSIGILPLILSLAFPILIVAIPVLPFFAPWWFSILAAVFAYLSFKFTRKLSANAIRERAVRDPEFLFEVMGQGVAWFTYRDPESAASGPSPESEGAKTKRDETAKTVEKKTPPPTMEIPSEQLLHQMNDEELRIVWEARPLGQWAPDFHVLSSEEKWLYFKSHPEMAFWEMPVSFVDEVRQRISQKNES